MTEPPVDLPTRIRERMEANRATWDLWTPVHAESEFYDVESFKAGKTSLMPLELEELGNVSGKSLLHLQCHFGMDTMSWAKHGAKAAGVDFSEEATALARSLNEELGLDAEFVVSNIYDLPDVLQGQYDIVFTSYGVKAWLPDLPGWANVITHFLRSGGTFYMAENHPFLNVLSREAGVTELNIENRYFHDPEGWGYETKGSYAGRSARTYGHEWDHSLGDVVNALIGAGLTIKFLHEFPFCSYRAVPMMVQSEDGWWRLPEKNESVPQTFSIMATK